MAHASGKSTPPRSQGGDGPRSVVAAESAGRGVPLEAKSAADQSRSLPKLDLERLARSLPKVGNLLSYSKLPIPLPPPPSLGRPFGTTTLRGGQRAARDEAVGRNDPVGVVMDDPVSVVMDDPVSVVMEESVSMMMDASVSVVMDDSVSVVMEDAVRVEMDDSVRAQINAPFRVTTAEPVSVAMDRADSSLMHDEFSVLMQSVTPAPKVRAVRPQANFSVAIWFGCGVLVLALGGVVAWRSSSVLKSTPITSTSSVALASVRPTVSKPIPEPARAEPAPVVYSMDKTSVRTRRKEARALRRQKLIETKQRKHELRKRLKREKRRRRHHL